MPEHVPGSFVQHGGSYASGSGGVLMRIVILTLLLLLPFAAHAQAPDVTAQADAVAIQGTRIFAMMAAQIEADQVKIADLQKKLDAATKPEAPK